MPARQARSAKKQTRLPFSPLSSSSPVKEKEKEKEKASSTPLDRLPNHGHAEHTQRSASREVKSPALMLPTPEHSSQPRPQINNERSAISTLDDSSSSSPISPLGALRPTSTTVLELSSDADSISPDASSSRRRARRHAPLNGRTSDSHRVGQASVSAVVIDTDEDDIPLPSAKRQRTHARKSARRTVNAAPRRSTRLRPGRCSTSVRSRSTSSFLRVKAVKRSSPAVSDLGSAETTGDEADIVFTSPTSRRRPQKAPRDEFVVDDEQIDYNSSVEEVVTPVKPRRRAEIKHSNDFVVDDDSVQDISSDDDPVTTPKRRKVSRSQRLPQKELRRKAELEEDLEDLADSDNVIQENRTRGAPVNKAREETRKHLEILRRRRAGEKVLQGSGTEDGTEETTSFDRGSRDVRRYSPSSGQRSLDSSEDSDLPSEHVKVNEDDFIVDDSAENIGVPHPDIPLEFTSYASRKPRELFVHVVDWLVKNKISPAFDRHDPLWDLAFKKLDDEVKGQAGSRLISASWNESFVRTLKARPGLTVVRLPGDEDDYIRTCDACNRTNHPAQYDFRFSGKAYYHQTLEPVETSDEENEDRDADTASLDSKNHVLPSSHQRFYLGRYCAANAEMGHKLTHWLFHLNQNLLAYLEEQGVLSADKVVARDQKTHSRREREAEQIVDAMVETGVVDALWRDFKSDMDDARIGMDGFEKKGGRGKARIGSIRVQRQDDDGEVVWEGDVRGTR